MSFFKNLFSSRKKTTETNKEETPISGINTQEDFDGRYQEDQLAPQMLDGCFKMIESYFMDNQIQRKVENPINHPINLDQTDQDGLGFIMYCKAFQLEEGLATMFLASAFSDYLIRQYGFKLYKDTAPEWPLRGMTLKYDKEGTVLSLYPFEYTSKVLNGNATFAALEEKLQLQLGNMPRADELIERLSGNEGKA